ncbi:jg25208 [Pararge aegeria aegeria]|uniref:Jg25208 protein n=1 Tax=Pararge aegeria aegeria TaxID=348720 RepID=A0A8S4RV40_9NEOP|nr:jg25208 [Pararge aegeria aegeria]
MNSIVNVFAYSLPFDAGAALGLFFDYKLALDCSLIWCNKPPTKPEQRKPPRDPSVAADGAETTERDRLVQLSLAPTTWTPRDRYKFQITPAENRTLEILLKRPQRSAHSLYNRPYCNTVYAGADVRQELLHALTLLPASERTPPAGRRVNHVSAASTGRGPDGWPLWCVCHPDSLSSGPASSGQPSAAPGQLLGELIVPLSSSLCSKAVHLNKHLRFQLPGGSVC